MILITCFLFLINNTSSELNSVCACMCLCVRVCSQADYRYSEINDKMNAITLKLGDAKVSGGKMAEALLLKMCGYSGTLLNYGRVLLLHSSWERASLARGCLVISCHFTTIGMPIRLPK